MWRWNKDGEMIYGPAYLAGSITINEDFESTMHLLDDPIKLTNMENKFLDYLCSTNHSESTTESYMELSVAYKKARHALETLENQLKPTAKLQVGDILLFKNGDRFKVVNISISVTTLPSDDIIGGFAYTIRPLNTESTIDDVPLFLRNAHEIVSIHRKLEI